MFSVARKINSLFKKNLFWQFSVRKRRASGIFSNRGDVKHVKVFSIAKMWKTRGRQLGKPSERLRNSTQRYRQTYTLGLERTEGQTLGRKQRLRTDKEKYRMRKVEICQTDKQTHFRSENVKQRQVVKIALKCYDV